MGANYTSPLANVLTAHKTITVVPTIRTIQEAVRRTLSVKTDKKRFVELDRIFKQIYEDDISGAISHDRFLNLSAEYEAGQRELEKKGKADLQEVDIYNKTKTVSTASPQLSASMWG